MTHPGAAGILLLAAWMSTAGPGTDPATGITVPSGYEVSVYCEGILRADMTVMLSSDDPVSGTMVHMSTAWAEKTADGIEDYRAEHTDRTRRTEQEDSFRK